MEYPHFVAMLFLLCTISGLFGWIPDHVARWRRTRASDRREAR